jgi:hypothetical protein
MGFKSNREGQVCADTCNVGKRAELWKASERQLSKAQLTICGRKASGENDGDAIFERKKAAAVENLQF